MSADHRLVLTSEGLAARALEGKTPAHEYGEVIHSRVIVPATPILRGPHGDEETDDQLIYGELFDVLVHQGMFGFGQARRDGYVGYVERSALAPAGAPATHRVSALRAYGFTAPDFKATPVGPFSMNSLLRVTAEEGRYRQVEGVGWFAVEQLSPIGVVETDRATVAERFVGTPYVWGGRTSLGMDCSGLVQQALYACGETCPRDSDMQRAFFRPIEASEAGRGDLVFWPEHVGMLLDAERVVHANARTMDVAVEPLRLVNALRAAEGAPSFARP